MLILILEIIQSTHFLDPTPQLRSSEYINKFRRQQIFSIFENWFMIFSCLFTIFQKNSPSIKLGTLIFLILKRTVIYFFLKVELILCSLFKVHSTTWTFYYVLVENNVSVLCFSKEQKKVENCNWPKMFSSRKSKAAFCSPEMG